jgi:glycosyltransferase involved in cell wall biosynthesis
MKTALVMLMTRYPDGDAGAVRGHAIAKLLSECGYDVTVIGYGDPTDGQILSYDGIKYTSLRLGGGSVTKKIMSRLTHGVRLVKYIKRNFPRVDLMVVDYMRVKTLRRIEGLARKYGAELYHDSCEWFSAEEFKNGERNSQYKYVNRLNTSVISPPWRVISISSYLDEHFRSRGVKGVRIPVILDVMNMEYALPEKRGKTIFVYAGSPGRKDFLSEMVRGFATLGADLINRLELHIIGISREGLINVCGADENDIGALGSSLIVHGRLKRSETVEWVRRADFTVLLRSSELRYTKAGFPTKVVESLASATPVITNLTSDLGEHLIDGVNSIVSAGFDSIAFSDALRRAMALDYEGRTEMACCARKCAEESFDYRVYKKLFE